MRLPAPLRASAPDGGLVAALAVLVGLGLVAVYSATAPLSFDATVPPHFLRQAGGMALGVLLALLASRVPLSAWRRAALPLWALGVALLVATAWVGIESHRAQRWLLLPGTGIRFQPGEIAKWTTLLALAAWLSRSTGPPERLKQLIPLLLLTALPSALLWEQPDTGNAILLMGLGGLLCFVAGTPWRLLAAPALLGGAALAAALTLRPYTLDRVRAFLDPWALADEQGFQLVQSFVAFGRGGAFGVGLGDGRQKLFYLPEAHTDFVLSVIAEELGVVGVALVLGAFAALWIAGCRIAARSRDRFTLLAAFAMTALVSVPAVLNAAVVMGLVPPKGLALPFVSYGRTSLAVGFLAIGILLRAARHEAPPVERSVRPAVRRRSWQP